MLFMLTSSEGLAGDVFALHGVTAARSARRLGPRNDQVLPVGDLVAKIVLHGAVFHTGVLFLSKFHVLEDWVHSAPELSMQS